MNLVLMLQDAGLESGGDADVKLFAFAGEDVDVGKFGDGDYFMRLASATEYGEPSLRSG
jgi:hypothetical protein